MTHALPIACSLGAGELADRLRQMAALGRDALVASRLEPAHAELRFAGAEVRERVDAIVAAESRCCAFLEMRVTDVEGGVVLHVDAPEGAEPVLAELVDAFRARPDRPALA